MIAFDAIVGILLGVVESPRDLLFDHGLQRLGEVRDDFDWLIVSKQRCSKECLSGLEVAALSHENIDHGSPGAGDFDASLINKPAFTDRVAAGSGGINE